MKIIGLLFILFHSLSYAQVIDFENIKDKEPGQGIEFMTLTNNPCQLRFFIGHNLQDTTNLSLQRVGFLAQNENNVSGGFQGIVNNKDCDEKAMVQNRVNQINYKPFVLNPQINSRKRVGCHFLSGVLRGENLPSVFIHFSIGTKACSGDILDLDGANDAIEAYEIYYYAAEEDFPDNPINSSPLKIRTPFKSFGKGEIGEDGGVIPFKINSETSFVLIEIRPNQQVSSKNKFRDVFGFALDNFSPFSIERSPYIPPYISGFSPLITVSESESANTTTYEDIYFGINQTHLSSKSVKSLENLISILNSNPDNNVKITGHTDKTGNPEQNLILSHKRVEKVKDYLIKNGIAEDRIVTDFKGEEEANNNSNQDWENRKVSIQLGK